MGELPAEAYDAPLDVRAVAAGATDLSSTADDTIGNLDRDDGATLGRHRRAAPAAAPSSGSVLDHPAALVALSVLALVALVLGLDSASQGRPWALVPALAVVALYVVVVRRRVARR